ncbi:N-acetyltransferase GCN5 [Rhizocola hellebori]|uniref:N-acetyltransferase GCN5 n=1 Tax=Rhizocola hellebori TaxID=1392758 RepID=A0A8J3VFL9_9ACTN|nr:N-acetyltransferase GCN5 [Rhizocola hellebori]
MRLRDVELADLETFWRQEQDEEATRRSQFAPREHDRFMDHWATKVLGEPSVFVQAVTVDGELAGSVVAWWQEGRRYLGYWLGREFWGRGVGTRALELFLEREKARPLYADPFIGNTASVKLLERHGFTREGSVFYDQTECVLLMLR